VILADTGAVVALVDRSDRHHDVLRALFEDGPDRWVLPWAILPEVDYLLSKYVGAEAERYFLEDVAGGAYLVEWNGARDLARAAELNARHAGLRLGLVDAVVIAMAERLRPKAIATLDERHFGSVRIPGSPLLFPRDC
jgi:uncharacterized protein